MTHYIYTITNTENGKLYIGRTGNPTNRKRSHFNKLRKGRHENPKLQNAWDKYGEICFVFDVVDECQEEGIYDLEKSWFAKYGEDEDLLYNCHFNSEGGKSLTPTGIQRNIDRIIPILDEGYLTGKGLNKLAKEHGVSSGYLANHIGEWEQLRGLVYEHPQTRLTKLNMKRFINDYNDNPDLAIANRDSYGISHRSFVKYLPDYGMSLEDIHQTKWKSEAIKRAREAYEYKVTTRCTVSEALRHTGANVTTFYKYVGEWRSKDNRPFNSEEIARCVILEMQDGMTMNKACKK